MQKKIFNFTHKRYKHKEISIIPEKKYPKQGYILFQILKGEKRKIPKEVIRMEIKSSRPLLKIYYARAKVVTSSILWEKKNNFGPEDH
jgi:predicted site-specific integrase-resolvase